MMDKAPERIWIDWPPTEGNEIYFLKSAGNQRHDYVNADLVAAPSTDAAVLIEQWRESNDWPGLVWSAQNLSDEPRWLAAWRDLEQRIATALTTVRKEAREAAFKEIVTFAKSRFSDEVARAIEAAANTEEEEQEMAETMFKVGQRVRLLTSIWDDGADHHPPGYLAHKGEELIVRAVDTGHEHPICVSHEEITDNSFRVALSEIEAI